MTFMVILPVSGGSPSADEKQATLKSMHVVLLSLRGYCTTIQCFTVLTNCSRLLIPNYMTKIVVSNLIFLIIYSFLLTQLINHIDLNRTILYYIDIKI